MKVEKEIQPKEAGTGPEYHRFYRVRFQAKEPDVKKAVEKLKTDIDFFSPQWIARFVKMKGSSRLRKGDEFEVRLSGPWNAPVRVTDVGSQSFAMHTLEGHPEAGKIRFSVEKAGPDEFLFRIESRARSKDGLVDFLYDKIPIVRLAQSTMWKIFCKKFARYARHPETGCEKKDEGDTLAVETGTEKKICENGQWIRI